MCKLGLMFCLQFGFLTGHGFHEAGGAQSDSGSYLCMDPWPLKRGDSDVRQHTRHMSTWLPLPSLSQAPPSTGPKEMKDGVVEHKH